MGFVANFICFPAVRNFENQLRFDKVTERLKVGTFLRHSVYILLYLKKQVQSAVGYATRDSLYTDVVIIVCIDVSAIVQQTFQRLHIVVFNRRYHGYVHRVP